MQNAPNSTYGAPASAGKSSTGLDANIAAAIAYLFGWVSGLVFYLIEKESRYVRFHAMQSIVLTGGFTVLWIVLRFVSVIFIHLPGIGVLFAIALGLIFLVFWLALLAIVVYCLVMAFLGKEFKLPFVGDIAAKYASR